MCSSLDDRTKGAWIVHHTCKMNEVINASIEYEQINLAGKCGLVLSAIVSDGEQTMKLGKVEALAKASGITKLELPQILEELERQQLIDRSENEVAILGLSISSVLGHINTIYTEANPTPKEEAVIELSEMVSNVPRFSEEIGEYISDNYRLSSTEVEGLLIASSEVGFVDAEQTRDKRKVLFNGNLFRKQEVEKISAVINSLTNEESRKVSTLNQLLIAQGCVPYETAIGIVGLECFLKVQSIGLFDVNTIGNPYGNFKFVTRPAAFSKFSNTIADDAFDMAKALVTSLTYGMTRSSSSRGRIKRIELLMARLIDGHWVGAATAIGQDYQILELKGVIDVREESNGRFSMRLLKKEVGQLALAVIQEGDGSTEAILNRLPGASVTTYQSPEINREFVRKKQKPQVKQSIANLLTQVRTGVV